MHPAKILLLEDEPVIALDLLLQLEDYGFVVLSATDTEEAVQLCALQQPALALLNFYHKGNANGIVLARALQEICPIKILFITGARNKDLEAAPRFAAHDDVLFKPFTRQQFRVALSKFIP